EPSEEVSNGTPTTRTSNPRTRDVAAMHDGEQLLGLPGPAPRFATVFRGYDRDQVDSWLREHERQVEGVAVPLGEMTRRERALEARFSELQPEATEAPSPTSLAAFVLGRAREIASELPQRMIREA